MTNPIDLSSIDPTEPFDVVISANDKNDAGDPVTREFVAMNHNELQHGVHNVLKLLPELVPHCILTSIPRPEEGEIVVRVRPPGKSSAMPAKQRVRPSLGAMASELGNRRHAGAVYQQAMKR